MRRLIAPLLVLVLLAAAGVAATWAFALRPAPAANVALLNDVVHVAQRSWPSPDAAALARLDGEITLVDATGVVRYTDAATPPADSLTAARQRAMVAPVVVSGQVVATAYVVDDLTAADAATRRDGATAATIAILAATLVAAGTLAWTNVRILRPFAHLESFATRVAAGDLDAPLAMDRRNVFGAWTESFDLMRSELAAAREREWAAVESKRTLMAQLSHDVRTPVATIAATAELLRSQAPDAATAQRLDVITAKAAHVDALVGDLFKANGTELAALTVTPTDIASSGVGDLIRAADHAGLVRLGDLPACLVHADPRRLAQVVDNVLANSYKYARTPIDVTARLAGPLLEVRFADAGPGVPDAELTTIFGRGVRGSNVGDVPGHGLGLYTCAWLMERMGGDIAAANDPGGFAVTLGIPLA